MSQLQEGNTKTIWTRIGHLVDVKESGLFVSPKLYILGCSPDGKVIDLNSGSDGDAFGLLEIKCPISKFAVSPVDACSDSRFYLQMQDNKPKLKKDHEYYDQVQGQMGLTGAKWCNFVVYTKAGMNIDRIPFDDEYWKQLCAKLCAVYFTHFLPIATKFKSGSSA